LQRFKFELVLRHLSATYMDFGAPLPIMAGPAVTVGVPLLLSFD
jgi:hypothetical protein